MRNLQHIIYLGVCLFGLSARAEVLLLNESQLGQDLFLRDATKSEEKDVSGCDYWTELFDPEALEYKVTCLAFGTSEGAGVAKEFEKASSSWSMELGMWSDVSADMPKYSDAAIDLDKYYLEVYEEAEHQIAANAQQNWMLMTDKEIQQNSIKEMLGNSFNGYKVKNSNDPTADLKEMMRDAEKMGGINRQELAEQYKIRKLNPRDARGDGYVGNGTFGLDTPPANGNGNGNGGGGGRGGGRGRR